jgi:hypothetical protein
MLVEFLARTELLCTEQVAISVGPESVIWATNICGRIFLPGELFRIACDLQIKEIKTKNGCIIKQMAAVFIL